MKRLVFRLSVLWSSVDAQKNWMQKLVCRPPESRFQRRLHVSLALFFHFCSTFWRTHTNRVAVAASGGRTRRWSAQRSIAARRLCHCKSPREKAIPFAFGMHAIDGCCYSLSTVRSRYKRQLIQLKMIKKWPTWSGMEDSRPIFSCKRFSYNENALYCSCFFEPLTCLQVGSRGSERCRARSRDWTGDKCTDDGSTEESIRTLLDRHHQLIASGGGFGADGQSASSPTHAS